MQCPDWYVTCGMCGEWFAPGEYGRVPEHGDPRIISAPRCQGSLCRPLNRSSELEMRLRELVVEHRAAQSHTDLSMVEGRMMERTHGIACHPEWFKFPCECDECMSYGEELAEEE